MPPSISFYIGQGLGILATLITLLSYQTNRNRRLLALQTAATLSNGLSYLFLQAYSGFALNLLCIVRNLIYYRQKPKTTVNRLSAVLLSLGMILLGLYSWQGPASLLIMSALAINTVFMSFGSPQLLRKSILLTSILILVYNVIVFSLGGIANESVALISSVIGIIRFRSQKERI